MGIEIVVDISENPTGKHLRSQNGDTQAKAVSLSVGLIFVLFAIQMEQSVPGFRSAFKL